MSQKICVLYGINEGPLIGNAFEHACREAGLSITRDPATADLIFAHSGGCLLVPTSNTARAILMVGVPYRPGRPWLISTAVKVWREGYIYYRNHRLKQWAIKWTRHIRYAANIRSGWDMAMNRSINKPWNSNQHQIILRNHYDAYCAPSVYKLPFRGPRTFISFSGEHDDCWENPEPYIRLLQLQEEGVHT